MSMVTVSTKRNRVYERAFDHEEAQRLRAEGWTYPALAAHFGVSKAAVYRVTCSPEQRHVLDARANQWMRDHREPCLGGCGRLVYMVDKQRTGYCTTCHGKLRSAANERETELRCTRCREWRPDDDFSKERRNTRRGRKSWCRYCETEARREYRRTHPEQERAAARNLKRKKKAMSEFVVLRKDDQGRWEEVERVQATSRLHAVERAASGVGIYAAVSIGQMTELPVEERIALKVVNNGPGRRNGSEPSE